VETIAGYAFCSQKYLRKVHTGKNTKIVGKCAFDACMELKKVSLGKKTKTIKSGAFQRCYKLSTIVDLEEVKKIGEDALWSTNIIYMPRWDANRNPPIARGDVMYIYMAAGSKKTTWSVTKGDKRVKILKRYKNSNRIKVKVKKKGYVVIQARQGSKKTECDFYIDH
nr:leucine-rich repeat domain-containing protein [Lachnospiraceae bacterium]